MCDDDIRLQLTLSFITFYSLLTEKDALYSNCNVFQPLMIM